ncbi:alpha/beta fold hydrolase [Aquisediminimonas sediminicola]|uniref:alpha/beta fold hydrolase n=1 Tax=Alteraquisediminimonas sediminicola TaxID=2676787 RepID=UPI001C8E2BFD
MDYLSRNSDVSGEGLRLAYSHHRASGPDRGPTIVFLLGYGSDMSGNKAMALSALADCEDRSLLLFDYAGCGASEGAFEEQTLADWRDDAIHCITALVEGPVLLVGSSMGGWLMLHVALALGDLVQGMIGVAAAPDFTDWGFTQDQKMTMLQMGQIEQPNEYGPEPTVTTAAFWKSGEAMRLLHAPIAIQCPVTLLHGQADQDVPWEYSVRLAKMLDSPRVETILIKDGDHRLSRPEDIARLLGATEWMLETIRAV